MQEEKKIIREEIDLVNTLESGQSFLWKREDGEIYGGTDTEEKSGPGPVYSTAVDGEGLRVWEVDEGLGYETTGVSESRVRTLLGLKDSLDDIHNRIDHDDRVSRAIDEYYGMRVVRDDFFPCVTSFIISAQNRIPRIKSLVDEIAETYGESIDGYDVNSFPSPEKIAEVDEDELREIGLGYRAPYVIESARMIADGEVDPAEIERMDYEDAHNEVQELVGVGNKVADCVLLFSLGFHEAVPIDTWIDKTVEEYYPELSGDSYSETAENFREEFGEYAGYAQNYLFHYIRNEG